MYLLLRVVFLLVYVMVFIQIGLAGDTFKRSVYPDMVSFGRKYDNAIVCFPSFKKQTELGEVGYDKVLVDSLRNLAGISEDDWNVTITLPDGFLDDYAYDRIGDTVIVLWSAGKFRARIEGMKLFPTMDYPFFGCVLKEIDPIPKSLSLEITVAVYRNPDTSSFMLIPLKEYSLSKSHLARLQSEFWIFIADSSAEAFNESFLESIKGVDDRDRRGEIIHSYLDHFDDTADIFLEPHIDIFAEKSNFLPDTLILAAREMWNRGKLELYMAIRFDEDYRIISHLASDGLYWGDTYIIDCAFDLDNDGNYEYLIIKDIEARILELVEGRFITILETGYGR